jgi:uncharacterized protein (TIGR02246 family)
MTFRTALLLALVVASPLLAADTKDDIVAVEKETFRAWAAQDAAAYGKTMAEDPVLIAASGGVYHGKQAILSDMAADPCEVKSYDFADAKVRMLSPDVAVLTYRLTQDVSCKSIGKLAPKAFVTSIYVRQSNEWRWVSYQETPLKK